MNVFFGVLIAGLLVSFHQANACEAQLDNTPFELRQPPPGETSTPINTGIVPNRFVSVPGTPVIHGIDVSKYQDDVDFERAYECGARFAYVRLSGGTDPNNELLYRVHWSNARSAGLTPGPYHNLSVLPNAAAKLRSVAEPPSESEIVALLPKARSSAQGQARIFVERLLEVEGLDPGVRGDPGNPKPRRLPIALDLSAAPMANASLAHKRAYGVIYREMICVWVNEVRKGLKRPDAQVVLFTTLSSYDDYALREEKCGLDSYPLWVSHRPADGQLFDLSPDPLVSRLAERICGTSPRRGGRCIFDQYTSFGGFAVFQDGSPLDLDRFIGDEEQFNAILETE